MKSSVLFVCICGIMLYVFQQYTHVPSASTLQCSLFHMDCPHDRGNMLSADSMISSDAFTDVRRAFVQQMNDGRAYGAQYSVYHRGELVVNLAGGHTTDRSDAKPYDTKTVQCLFSSGKTVENIVMSSLVHRGAVSYHAPIASVWPEFAAGNKDRVTLAHLLRHEGGVAWLDGHITLANVSKDVATMNDLSKLLANTPHTHSGEHGHRVYHGVLRGLILNEIVRHADDKHRTFEQYLHDEILTPLGEQQEFFVGVPPAAANNAADVIPFSLPKVLSSILLGWTGLAPVTDPPAANLIKQVLLNTSSEIYKGTMNAIKLEGSPIFDSSTDTVFNSKRFRSAQMSSGNMYASSRALAHMVDILNYGGELHGHVFFDKKVNDEALHIDPKEALKRDAAILLETEFTDGGWCRISETFLKNWCKSAQLQEECLVDTFGDVTFYGWSGTGGNVIWTSPQLQLTMSYNSNTFAGLEMWNSRARELFWHTMKALGTTTQ